MAHPLFRWAGSKKKLVSALIRSYRAGNAERYIEPFAGSACLFFALEPNHAILGDINADLISTYRVVRRSPHRLHAFLSRLPNNRETYYRMRGHNPASLSQSQRAVRFLYLNRYCFNGLYRTNAAGQFNVPYGGSRTGPLPGLHDLARCSQLLKRAQLVAGDFMIVLERVRADDFVYLDPPYQVRRRRVFRQYHESGFSVVDVERLRKAIQEIDRRDARFLLSYAESVEGRFLAKGFVSKRVKIRRNIAGFAGNRRSAYELLISNRPLGEG